MYKNAMRAVVRCQGTYGTLFASPGVQMILASYCVLLQWDHDDLTAPYWRWYWNDAAGATIRIGNEDIALLPDRVVLIPPGTAFGTHTKRPVGHLHMHFVTGLRPADREHWPMVRKPTQWQRTMMSRLRRLLMAPAAPRGRHAADYLTHAVVTSQLADIPDRFWESNRLDGDIRRILALMHEQPTSVDVRSLPGTIAVSPNTLVRRFRRVTGTTPARYLMRLRIDNAALDLRATDDSIEAIAVRHGFCDRFHFSKTFKEVVGLTPAVYRADRSSVAWGVRTG